MTITPEERFLQIDPDVHAEVLLSPSAEQLFYARLLPSIFAPSEAEQGPISRAFGVFAVIPSVHYTIFSMPFQSYLYDVFHRTRTAQIGHALCMPLITGLLIALAGDFAGVAAAILCVWYAIWGLVSGHWLWGAVMQPVVGALYLGAIGYQQLFREPGGWETWSHPLPWIAFLSLVQTLSHFREPDLPPRANGTKRWLPLRPYLFEVDGFSHLLIRSGRVLRQIFFGCFDEFWASPRLLPISVLRLMWRLGYRGREHRALRALSEKAIADGNPALDYVGIGGGTYLRPVPLQSDPASEDRGRAGWSAVDSAWGAGT